MFDTTDTIVAIATPAGRGGLGIVRLSGPDSIAVARRILALDQSLHPRYATLTRLAERPTGDNDAPGGVGTTQDPVRLIDQVVVLWFPSPASYTGEDVVELSAHGSPVVLRQIVESATRAGARLAEPGEFTLRAFLSGKLDLVQAEAVRDLIDAVTPAQARAAFDQLDGTLTDRIADIDREIFDVIARLEASLDFPDEGYHFIDADTLMTRLGRALGAVRALVAAGARGRIVREGRQVVIVGRPNVGKSSLFNALVGAERAIVTTHPGTTRDLVTEQIDLDGMPVTLVDTAGVREATEPVERAGVLRSRGAIDVADVVVLVLDGSEALTEEDAAIVDSTRDRRRVIVVNKADRPAAWPRASIAGGERAPGVSATHGEGVADLRATLAAACGSAGVERDDDVSVTNMRHVRLLEAVAEAIDRALTGAREARSEEFLLADLHEARSRLENITGSRTSEDILRHIFASFCIGK